MKPFAFHPDAAQEARDAAARYEGLRAGFGDDFRAELEAALARIRQNCNCTRQSPNSIRVCPLHRFPYAVFYEELADRVWVAAVAHHSRRPGYWARRRPSS